MADCSRVLCDPSESSSCEELYAEGEYLSIVVPTRGDNYRKGELVICALKRITDSINDLEARVFTLEGEI